MDTPHLPTKVVAESFAIASTCSIEKNKVLNEVLGDPFTEGAVQETAYICPAYDGGYVLLSLPPAVANGNNAYRAFEVSLHRLDYYYPDLTYIFYIF
mmetsp:Transcript_14981/g.17514  ORF Transcript_14981/g.17514 Transcript_14981/m.17514 type:complete len:97 (+) Transcript_14981:730-1020(+)